MKAQQYSELFKWNKKLVTKANYQNENKVGLSLNQVHVN